MNTGAWMVQHGIDKWLKQNAPKESEMATTTTHPMSYCELCGIEMDPDDGAVCDVCWAQQHGNPSAAYDAWVKRPEFPVYHDAQGREHAEF